MLLSPITTANAQSLLLQGLMRYADPSQNPIRVLAREAFLNGNVKQAREMLEMQLRAENANESDLRYLLSIFDGVVSAQRDRAMSVTHRRIRKTQAQPKRIRRTEWIEELDL